MSLKNTNKIKRIGILTGGGDCPGLNAVIRSVAKPAMTFLNAEVIGIEDGFEGMVNGKAKTLSYIDVSGIINKGGTILGTSNKGDPFRFPIELKNGAIEIKDCSENVVKNYFDWKLDALVVIGGDGTMSIAEKLSKKGLNIVGVPKTIDNDLDGTDITFGHDSAIAVATDAVDRLQTTASSHKRVMILEVMGRYAGWIALASGIAGAADIILIPEIKFSWEKIFDMCLKRSIKAKFSIVVVAEGTKFPDGNLIIKEKDKKRTDPIRLGGIGEFVAQRIQQATSLETRAVILGHTQRGGSPTAFDRILATKYGAMAIKSVIDKNFNTMVSLKGDKIISIPISDVVGKLRLVTQDNQMVLAAKSVGTSFGD